ncbi:MAG: sigma-54 dependent transcriptional regulator [Chthoniobacteraceae bacterium]
MAKILIVDDEPHIVELVVTACKELGHETFPFTNSQKALDKLESVAPQLVISDIKMGKVDGFEVLRSVRNCLDNCQVILMTGQGNEEIAEKAIAEGARYYIRKPFKISEMQARVKHVIEFSDTAKERDTLKKVVKRATNPENIIGTSPKMDEVYHLIRKIADTDSTILIQGESGTGKELVARALHFNSSRQHHPFVAINCSALPENLLESELFGHKKGSFTGAVADKAGLFEEAERGTIFLDEVNSMALPLQTKLLRVLQERQLRRVGDTKTVPINVRVLGATNESLLDKVKDGKFREDLYYRLAVIPIELPPLRDRPEDIPLLVQHFLKSRSEAEGGTPIKIEPKAVECLQSYNWPGNVRELENAIERASALCDDQVIRMKDLPPQVIHHEPGSSGLKGSSLALPIGKKLDDFIGDQERFFINETIKHTGGNREKAAKILGISMATLYRKIEAKTPKAVKTAKPAKAGRKG